MSVCVTDTPILLLLLSAVYIINKYIVYIKVTNGVYYDGTSCTCLCIHIEGVYVYFMSKCLTPSFSNLLVITCYIQSKLFNIPIVYSSGKKT